MKEGLRILISDNGKHETWQMCPKCNAHYSAPSFTHNKGTDCLCSLNPQSTCSQQSNVSRMSPYLVYTRRKLLSANAPSNSKRSADSLSVVSSDDILGVTKDQHAPSLVAPQNEAVRLPSLSVACGGECQISTSKLINVPPSCVEDQVSNDRLKIMIQKTIEVDSINDSCSSSRSNMDPASASKKGEMDDSGECSSSSVVVAEVLKEDLSENDICISLMRDQGLLERGQLSRTLEDIETFSNKCSRFCNICGRTATALKMLICDNCEEAFHVACCNLRIKKIPNDEWICSSCLKKRKITLSEATARISSSITSGMDRSRNAISEGDSNRIALMLRETEPCVDGVRIGKGFQVEVPNWSGPVDDPIVTFSCYLDLWCSVDTVDEPLEINSPEHPSFHDVNSYKSAKFSIGNWLQCRGLIDGIGVRGSGSICGKWRRAPLFEVQTGDWECFCSVHWDPSHADCAVPQELETEEVLKQLKYVEVLRHRLSVKRQRSELSKNTTSLHP